ncbi:MAG: hypothetical protein ACHQU0_00355 [Candidatus Paceibacteria bacterium]
MEKELYVLGPELHPNGVEDESFDGLADIAIRDLRFQGSSILVCGPITSGGTGHPMLNLEIFNATIDGLKSEGVNIFSQIPYEHGLRKLAYAWEAEGNTGYCMPILEIFYERVFATRLIVEGRFIPRWQSSRGATWERQSLPKHGSGINDLSLQDIRRFMEMAHPREHVDMVMELLHE